MKLTDKERVELEYLRRNPGVWRSAVPERSDKLRWYLDRGLVEWLGDGNGYRISESGRAALEGEERT